MILVQSRVLYVMMVACVVLLDLVRSVCSHIVQHCCVQTFQDVNRNDTRTTYLSCASQDVQRILPGTLGRTWIGRSSVNVLDMLA